jgi:hypothetical protein
MPGIEEFQSSTKDLLSLFFKCFSFSAKHTYSYGQELGGVFACNSHGQL